MILPTQTHLEDLQGLAHSLLPISAHRIDHRPPNAHRRRTQRDRLEHIGSSADTAIHEDFELASVRPGGEVAACSEGGDDPGKDGEWRRGEVLRRGTRSQQELKRCEGRGLVGLGGIVERNGEES